MKHSSQHRQGHVSAVLLLALVGVPTLALADTATNRQIPPSKPKNETSLPEVKASAARIYPGAPNDVARTGSKTDTPLRDIPASVAVVPEKLLKEQGAVTMNDAMRNVSSVQPVMGGGYGFANNYTSRGLGLSFLRDDMPDGPTQNGYFRTMHDIDRIEVLKGPGSALFGSAGPGGSINLVTKKPQDNFNLSGGATFGSFGTGNGHIDLTGPMLNKAVASRLIVDGEHTDGFRGLKRDIVEVSPSLAWHIADNKTLSIDFDHRDAKITPDNYGIVFDGQGKLANVSREARYYTPFNYTNQEINRVGITHDWAISDALGLRSALIYEDRELNLLRNAGGNASTPVVGGAFGARNLRQQSDDAGYLTFQNELTWKVTTGIIKHTVLSGLEYKNSDMDTVRVGFNLPSIANILNPVIPETSLAALKSDAAQGFNRRITGDTVSLYAQEQMAFGEQFKVRTGLRDDIVSYQDNGRQGTTTRSIESDQNLVTGSIGGVYQPTPWLAFYTGYSRGAFVNLATESPAVSLKPETSDQVEVGTKATLFDDKLDLNLALFDTERENYFVTLPGALFATPDGKDQTRGLEMDFGIHPLVGWNITGNAVWMDPKVKSNVLASNALFGVNNQSIAGTRPTGVSKETFSIWNSYQIQSGFAQGLGFGLGVTHKSDAYADSLNLLKVPSYTTLDAAISYRQPRWEAVVNLKNLTDANYYTNPTFTGALPGEPLSVYGSLRFNFN